MLTKSNQPTLSFYPSVCLSVFPGWTLRYYLLIKNMTRTWEGEIGAVGFEGISFSFFPKLRFFLFISLISPGGAANCGVQGAQRLVLLLIILKRRLGRRGYVPFWYLISVPTWPTTPFQDLVLLSQAPHRKFASLKVTFSLRILIFKDYIISSFWSFFKNWTVAEWNLPVFINEQPYVVVLQGPLVEGGGISVVLHLEVGREGGVGHSAIERLPNWAEC